MPKGSKKSLLTVLTEIAKKNLKLNLHHENAQNVSAIGHMFEPVFMQDQLYSPNVRSGRCKAKW